MLVGMLALLLWADARSIDLSVKAEQEQEFELGAGYQQENYLLL